MGKLIAGILMGITLIVLICDSRRLAKAEPRPVDAPPTRIALIDMAKVFKTSSIFEDRRMELKREIADTEDIAKRMQSEAQRLKQRLDGFENGSEERKELEKQLKTKSEEFEKFRRAQSARFLKIEAQIYRDVYLLVTEEVRAYSIEHKIDLVIRHGTEGLDEEDPQKLLQNLNRLVIFDNGLDITDDIIAAMKTAAK